MKTFKQYLLTESSYWNGLSPRDREYEEKLARQRIASNPERHSRDYVTHPSNYIRELVARYGTDQDRDRLLNNKVWGVRATVGVFGNARHKRAPWNDENEHVKKSVRTNRVMYSTDD